MIGNSKVAAPALRSGGYPGRGLYNYTIMRSLFKKLSGLIWHPFFLILFALLFLLAANYGRISRGSTLRPALLFFALTGLILLLGRWWLKDWHRAGLIASLSLLLFFSYGHLYGLLEGVSVSGLVIGRHRVLLVVYALIWVGFVHPGPSYESIPAGVDPGLEPPHVHPGPGAGPPVGSGRTRDGCS